jgi:hypothetical protein
LEVDEIEERLRELAKRQGHDERNIAYYLLDVQKRSLFSKQGFSNIYDYVTELLGFSRRKCQYLLAMARSLEKLPAISAAFDSGSLSWTKVREIVKVATKETEEEWLKRAKRTSNRELEQAVKCLAPSGEFQTMRITMPEDVYNLWLECEEVAKRLAERELEPWQALEQMMAEFLSTYAGAEAQRLSSRRESDPEKDIPLETRDVVLERDGCQCRFPGCSMRCHLEIHHIVFRSRGGSHTPENLVTLCSSHHGLIHQHICGVEGRAPDVLQWKGPFLIKWPRALEPFRNGVRGRQSAVQPAPEAEPIFREHVFAVTGEQQKGQQRFFSRTPLLTTVPRSGRESPPP